MHRPGASWGSGRSCARQSAAWAAWKPAVASVGPPQAGPKVRILHFQPPGGFSKVRLCTSPSHEGAFALKMLHKGKIEQLKQVTSTPPVISPELA